jgi:AAA domain-containing protein
VIVDGSRTRPSAEAEFDRMREGERGVGLIQATPTSPADRGCRCQLHGADARSGSGEPPPGEGPDSQAAPGRLGMVLTRSELASLPGVQPLIDGVVSTPAAVLLVGGYGLGKTFLALSFAASVATGRDWLGRRVQRRRGLFVLGEGAYGLDPRVCAWEAAWNEGEPVSDDDLTFIVKPGSLNEAATWQELVGFATDGGYGLVVLDTFSSLAPDADETKDAARMTRRLSDLSTAINGCALLVHHPGWSDAGRSRGGYQLEANTDEVLILAGVGDGTNQVTLTRKKVKDGPDGEVLWLRRTAAHGSVIIEGSRADDAAVPLRARIRAVLANYGEIGATGPQLMAELGIEDKGRSGFYTALRKLDEDGLVRSEGQRQRKRYYQASPL